MTKDEALAMDLALEALERLNHEDSIFAGEFEKTITAIKQARSAPVQEPVAWLYKDDWGRTKIAFSKETANEWGAEVQPLYTTPPAQPAPVYVKTFHGGKPWPLHPAPVQERNFCERCGKRIGNYIHTCTPPLKENT
jgi:hypothetical protein